MTFISIQHSTPGEILNIHTLKENLPKQTTFTLVKTENVEVIRMFLPEGKMIPEHSVSGEITVQCLSGEIDFLVDGQNRRMGPGDWLYLGGDQKHALNAVNESVVLVTILLR